MNELSLPDIRINSERLQRDFDELAAIGSTADGGVTRIALSNEDLEARSWFAEKVEEAGLFLRDDEVGNLSGVLPARNYPNPRTFLIGSHLDTVRDSGLYDGSIGVLVGLEILRTLNDAQLTLPHHIEVINFTDEEGSWQSFFGSLGLTGQLKPHHLNDVEQDNSAFRAALFRAGIPPTEFERAKRQPEQLAGYLELHIEQGERLQRAHKQIGVVTGIVGRSGYQFTFYGEATHAATTEPDKQRDALQGAAIFITEMHRMTRERYPQGIVNCGNITVLPGTFNVIPARAELRVELRHPDPEQLAQMEVELVELAQYCAEQYKLEVTTTLRLKREAALMDEHLCQVIEQVCQANHYPHMRLASYAGHDAQMLSKLTPSGMIFIPSLNGISHNPREYSEWLDVEAGAHVLLQTLLHLLNEDC